MRVFPVGYFSEPDAATAEIANIKHGWNQYNKEGPPMGGSSEGAPPTPIETAAAMTGAKVRTSERAAAVKNKGTENLFAAVKSGGVSLRSAEDLATLPKEEQNDLVSAGSKAMKKRAKEIRDAKTGEPAEPEAEYAPPEEGGRARWNFFAPDVKKWLRAIREVRS